MCTHRHGKTNFVIEVVVATLQFQTQLCIGIATTTTAFIASLDLNYYIHSLNGAKNGGFAISRSETHGTKTKGRASYKIL